MADLEPQAEEVGRIGDAMGRGAARFGRRLLDGCSLASFLYGFSLARRAGRMLIRRPGLTLAVLLLASLWLLSELACGTIVVRMFDRSLSENQRLAFPSEQHFGFVGRWLHGHRYGSVTEALAKRPLREFPAPLWRTDFVAPWVRLLNALMSGDLTSGRSSGGAREAGNLLATSCLGEAVGLLIFIPLLGWIRDRRRPISMRDLPRYWRAHYLPLLGLGVLGAIWAVSVLASLTRGFAAEGFGDVAARAIDVLLIAPIALMLTPFVIVGRGTGLWEGVVGGLRLLGRNWGAVVALFLCFYVGHALIAAWDAIPPWPEGLPQAGFAIGPTTIPWLWASTLASALLGLWVAYALMDIAHAPQPAQAEDTAQA